MNKVFKRFGAYVMMLVLFATSTGFTMFSHMCFMDGQQAVSASKIDSCCPIDQVSDITSLTSDCCDDETNFYKLDYLASVQRSSDNDFVLLATFVFQAFFTSETSVVAITNYSPQPPPKSGREILSDIRTLQI